MDLLHLVIVGLCCVIAFEEKSCFSLVRELFVFRREMLFHEFSRRTSLRTQQKKSGGFQQVGNCEFLPTNPSEKPEWLSWNAPETINFQRSVSRSPRSHDSLAKGVKRAFRGLLENKVIYAN